MAWYKAKLSDGTEHRLWFGHDPSETDVLAALKAPTMAEGAPLADQPDTPEVGVGGSPLQRAMGTEADPNSPEKLLKGAMFAASFPGGPAGMAAGGAAKTVLGRAAQVAAKPSVVGGALAAGGAALEGASPKHIAYAGAVGAGLPLIPGVGKFTNKALAAGLERLAAKAAPEVDAALSARIAHTLTREAPEAVVAAGKVASTASGVAPGASQAARALEGAGLSPELATAEAGKMASATGDVSGNLPGVMTPAGGVKMPAVAVGEQIQAQVQTLRASGLSKPQIVQTLRETYGHSNLSADTAEKMVDMISGSSSRVAATAEALPAGSRVMPSYRGGKAQPSLGPARVPANDQDLMSLLQGSIDAYRLK